MVYKNLPMGVKILVPVNDEHAKGREPLYNRVVTCFNTIYNHTDTSTILPWHEGYSVVSETKIPSNTHTLLVLENVKSSF